MADLSITPSEVKPIAGNTPNAFLATTVTAGQIVAGDPQHLGPGAFPVSAANAGWGNQSKSFFAYTVSIAVAGGSAGQFVPRMQTDFHFTPAPVSTVDLGVSTTKGQLYFLSHNAGHICPYADLQSGDHIVIVGIGLGGTQLRIVFVDTGLVR